MYVSQSTKTTADNRKAARTTRSDRASGINRETGINKTAASSRNPRGRRSTTLASRSNRIVIESKHRASAKDIALFILSVCSLAGFAVLAIWLTQILAKLK